MCFVSEKTNANDNIFIHLFIIVWFKYSFLSIFRFYPINLGDVMDAGQSSQPSNFLTFFVA